MKMELTLSVAVLSIALGYHYQRKHTYVYRMPSLVTDEMRSRYAPIGEIATGEEVRDPQDPAGRPQDTR